MVVGVLSFAYSSKRRKARLVDFVVQESEWTD